MIIGGLLLREYIMNYYSIMVLYWGHIGIMENRMETTIVYWGYMGL